jgi:hypothetical protein
MSQIKQDRHHLGSYAADDWFNDADPSGYISKPCQRTIPELLSQEQVNHLMQSTFEADDGNGAPGNVITKSSSTTQQESGQKE